MQGKNVEHGIPIPVSRRGGPKYPFRTMKVGESVFFEVEAHSIDLGRIRRAAYRYNERTTKRFVCRALKEADTHGVRIWRTK